jgi:hypothetical protein
MIASQPLSMFSTYEDTASNPATGPYTYALTTYDSCGESTLSKAHTTIFLQATTDSSGKNELLSWSPYVGITVSNYSIYRGPTFGSMALLTTVSPTTYNYTDSNAPSGSIYLVSAVDSSGPCVPSIRIKSKNKGGGETIESMSNFVHKKKTLGVDEVLASINKLSIYPNPGNGQFTVSYSLAASSSVRITVIDEIGHLVYDAKENKGAGTYKEEINLESLAEGIYSLRLVTVAGVTVKKVIIIHNR